MNSTEGTLYSRIFHTIYCINLTITPSSDVATVSDKYSMEPQANTTCNLMWKKRGQKTYRMHMWFPSSPRLHPQSDIKQTCWNVNGTWLLVHRAGWASTVGYCTARQGDPSGTTALLGVFQTIQTTFPLCWVSWAWADGVSRRALLFLLLLIFALNWKMMSRLKAHVCFCMPHVRCFNTYCTFGILWSLKSRWH